MALQTARRDTAAEDGRSTDLRDSPMMTRLLDNLEQGNDIGHYGRLVFVMVAHHFLDDDAIVRPLAKQPDHDEEGARSLVAQVKAHDYNPPSRDKILAWQARQDFAIIPNPDDPDAGNIYGELSFPEDVYDRIGEYYEEKADAHHR